MRYADEMDDFTRFQVTKVHKSVGGGEASELRFQAKRGVKALCKNTTLGSAT